MRIAIISPPFIPVPPVAYGGTELFVAQLAEGLADRGHQVIVYANGESRVRCEMRWLYPHADWPPVDAAASHLKNADHTAWAVRDAAEWADVVHVNDAVALPFTRFLDVPVVLTDAPSHEPVLSAMYERYPRSSTWRSAMRRHGGNRWRRSPSCTMVCGSTTTSSRTTRTTTWRSSAGWCRARARMPRSPSLVVRACV